MTSDGGDVWRDWHSMAPDPAADMTDAELAAHLRDPSTSDGLLPQWIRDDIAARLERGAEVLRRLALMNEVRS